MALPPAIPRGNNSHLALPPRAKTNYLARMANKLARPRLRRSCLRNLADPNLVDPQQSTQPTRRSPRSPVARSPLVLDRHPHSRSRDHRPHRRRTSLPRLPRTPHRRPQFRQRLLLQHHMAVHRHFVSSLRPHARPPMAGGHPRRPGLRSHHQTYRPTKRRHLRSRHHQPPAGNLGLGPRRFFPVVEAACAALTFAEELPGVVKHRRRL